MLKFIHPTVKTVVLSFLLIFPLQFIAALPSVTRTGNISEVKITVPVSNTTSSYESLYDNLHLSDLELSEEAYTMAVRGFKKMMSLGALGNTDILSIVDFSLPSYKKRLFVIDMATGSLLFNTYVAHGRNSGQAIAKSFSNHTSSFKSSLGFYITGDTYIGDNGYSLRLQGKEKGINDNAFNRRIVMHGAPYVSEDMIAQKGYLGRSLGCPAVPQEVHKEIIETIRNGSCLFIYNHNKTYLSKSALVKPTKKKSNRA
jgi:hypothetical protein